MKKRDVVYLVSLAAYSYLFWKQAPGLNVFVMNLVLLVGIVLSDKTVLRNRNWMFCAIGAIVTSLFEAYYGNGLCFFGNFISLLGVAGYSVRRGNSWIATAAMSFVSGASAVGFIVIAAINRMSTVQEEKPHRFSWKRALLLLIVLLIALLFFVLYRGSSILFQSLTDKIDLSFISIGWCIFMIAGAVLVFGFYHQQKFSRIAEWERSQPSDLQLKERLSLFDKIMTLDSEYFSGIVLLGLLNLMLITVNSLDIMFLTSGNSFLPENVTFSQYVHQGIDMLILSIVCATIVILYYFRNYHASTGKYSALKWLALLWVAQNIFMVATTIYRNHTYVFVFGLTYLRIGVDVFLLFALIGLVLITWKIIKQKSFAFLFRASGWAFFAVVVVFSPVNWDQMIFNYNASLHRRLDMMYLNNLSSSILAEQHSFTKAGYTMTHDEKLELDRKTFSFLTRQRMLHDAGKWQSYTFIENRVYEDLLSRKSLANDTMVYAAYCGIDSLYFFPGYACVKEIDASVNEITSIGEIAKYQQLETLDLEGNGKLTSIAGIENCVHLRDLNLYGTTVHDFSPLLKMPWLRHLKIQYMDTDQLNALKAANPRLVIDFE